MTEKVRIQMLLNYIQFHFTTYNDSFFNDLRLCCFYFVRNLEISGFRIGMEIVFTINYIIKDTRSSSD